MSEKDQKADADLTLEERRAKYTTESPEAGVGGMLGSRLKQHGMSNINGEKNDDGGDEGPRKDEDGDKGKKGDDGSGDVSNKGDDDADGVEDKSKKDVDDKSNNEDDANKGDESKSKKPVKYEDMEKSQVIDELKKWQRIAEHRKETGVTDKFVNEFFESFRKDPFGALDKYAEKFNIPTASFLRESLEKPGDIDSQIEQWKKDVLIPDVEKKFKMEEGTFVFDASELQDRKSPSSYFLKEVQKKESELEQQFAKHQQTQGELAKKIQEQASNDKEYIRKSFFPEGEDGDSQFEEKMQEFDLLPDKLVSGELGVDMNPFSIKNIFRGVYFDSLAQQMVDEAIAKIHKEYQQKGVVLSKNGDDDLPADVSKMKGGLPEKDKDKKYRVNENSPQSRIFGKYINN